MTDNQDLAKVPEPQKNLTIAVDDSSFSSYLDTAKFNQLWRVANVFAGSDIVPEHYRNKPNNCFLALQMSTRLEIEPMMFIQNSYVVHGKPGLQSVVIIALVNSRGPFTGPIQWRFEGAGKDRKCIAYATHKVTKEVCEATVSWAMVDAEGWNKKPGSKWLTLPDLMFQYRSAAFLAKLYCPEVILGLPTAEELEDIDQNGNPAPLRPISSLEGKLTKQIPSTTLTGADTDKAAKEAEKAAAESTPAIAAAAAAVTDAADLEELNTFSKPPVEKSKETAQDAPQSTEVPANERFHCRNCEKTSGALKGTKKNLCPSCLSDQITDRWHR